MNDMQLQIDNIELSRERLYVLQQKHEELEILIRTGQETVEQSYALLKQIDELLAT